MLRGLDPDYLIQFACAAKEAGADRLRYCDTIGILDPFKTYDRITRLLNAVPIEVEMHTHNDFGMATANALARAKSRSHVCQHHGEWIWAREQETPVWKNW